MVTFWNQNKILVCFFVLLTGITVYSFFDQSDEEKKELTAKVSAELIKNAQAKVDRQPASMAEKPIKTNTRKIKVFCSPATDLKVRSEKSLLMLEVSTCKELSGKHQLWVKNISNGFKAQVFKISGQNFRTDFLQLNDGLNKIEIEGILKDGQKIVQTLEIQSGS